MVDEAEEPVPRQFTSALEEYLGQPDGKTLHNGYQAGRRALVEGAGFSDLVAAFQTTLGAAMAGKSGEDAIDIAENGIRFLTNALSPLEMMVQAHRDAAGRLQRMNATLQAQIAERTGELEQRNRVKEINEELRSLNQALEEARAQAEHANLAKSEFLSRMSHELRTPLNAVLGFAQLLEVDGLSEEQQESVTHILKAGSLLLELINEVLDIARIESGRMALSPEAFLVQEAIGQAVDLAHPLAAERDIQLTVESPGREGVYVQADSNRLKQVLLNLLSNAVKYNHQGGQVGLSWTATPEGLVRISVSDTGPGIPPDMLNRVFQPFDRLGAESTGVEGTGLGLALSKALVEAMGGSIGVQSVVGQGSTFWLELPTAEKPAEVPAYPLPGPSGGQRLSIGATIVYVEDNLSNVTLVTRLLARYPGVRLLTAMQGQLGLELVRHNSPDLVILDLNLPDMSGEVVLRRLQQDPRTQDIPVVILSAEASPGHIQRLLAAGARAYLTKPLDVRQVLRVLQETLPSPPEEESHGQPS